ncbi:MAG: hypothetical protein RIF44_17400 [Nitratireductor sp.]
MAIKPGARAFNFLSRPLPLRLQRQTWMLIGLAVLAVALYWRQSWLAALGVAPFLIALLPCMAMCALGLCMHGGTGKKYSDATQDGERAGSTVEPRD